MDKESIGALWMKEGKKGMYLSGTIQGQAVVCFRNDHKTGNQPDWKVYPSTPPAERPVRQPLESELIPADKDIPF